jgi:hypothetical protein
VSTLSQSWIMATGCIGSFEPLNRSGCSVLVLCPAIWVVLGSNDRFIFGVGYIGMFTTEDVKINTVQIEIKSLTVGRKQLTLSLMRQIIEEDLIDHDTLQFKGIPWGHVNYFWGSHKDLSFPEYLNIIWQKGKVLRRCVIKSFERYHDYDEKRARSELRHLQKQLDDMSTGRCYYGESQMEARINHIHSEMNDWEEHIAALVYKKEVYLPRYNDLIGPLINLEHFYIAV